MGVASSFSQLLVLRILLGVAQAPSVPAIAGVVADSFTPRTRATAVSFYLLAYLTAVFVAGYMGGTIAETPAMAPAWKKAARQVKGTAPIMYGAQLPGR